MKNAKYRIDRSDPAYPKLVRYVGLDQANNVDKFDTLGTAKKYLIGELTSMKDHYLSLIDDTRKVSIKSLNERD